MPRTEKSKDVEFLLGIDGGGTKTTAWLVRSVGETPLEVVGRGAAGGCNPRAIGLPAAGQALRQAIQAAQHDAHAAHLPVARAVLAIAGAAHADVAEPLRRWAESAAIARHVEVVSDATPLLAAGTPDGWGVALVGGTGSVAHAQTSRGATATVGGWGYLLGDDGSGFWLGRAALRAVIQAAESGGPTTALSDTLLSHLQLTHLSDLKSRIYGEAAGRVLIASLAEPVVRTAEAGDHVASQLLDKAAVHLARLVESAAAAVLEDNASFPLALTGGLLLGSERLPGLLVSHLAARGCQPAPITRVPEPVAGCLRLLMVR